MGAPEISCELCPKKFARSTVTQSGQSWVQKRPGSSQCHPLDSREGGSSFRKHFKRSSDISPAKHQANRLPGWTNPGVLFWRSLELGGRSPL